MLELFVTLTTLISNLLAITLAVLKLKEHSTTNKPRKVVKIGKRRRL